MKRLFDLVLSIGFLLVFFPIGIIIAVLIKINSPGPVLYLGNRIGQGGEGFKILKYRTMIDNADKIGLAITPDRDNRITRVGRVLRKLKLDEVPQLINVIRGEMSVVGPRPEHPMYVKTYTPNQLQVLSVRPGLASPAFIKFRHEEEILAKAGRDQIEFIYITKVLPEKLEMDLEYCENQSFLGDLRIFIDAGLSLFK